MDLKWKIGFAFTAIASLFLFVISLYDIIYLQHHLRFWFYASIGIVFLSLILFIFMYRSSHKKYDSVALFEKTLQGRLYHFMCRYCGGMFAVKESRKNDIHSLTLTCPYCGSVGRISDQPPLVIDRIPSEKSPKVSFLCTQCGERLNIWAEGSSLSNKISIFSCPYCGSNKPMKPLC
ncbi:MAG: NADH-quinone oxidoreductase subunit J [Candidatus Thermoplasmatota archaeon]|nr:NADH-quinone oxidoreductase subunit J [Candidatus Thermoplasmatota archaeon]MBS3801212.1 NADH-quinone oxidoreductase subunit J [Candidatus Thermoplasmatota archaeon]